MSLGTGIFFLAMCLIMAILEFFRIGERRKINSRRESIFMGTIWLSMVFIECVRLALKYVIKLEWQGENAWLFDFLPYFIPIGIGIIFKLREAWKKKKDADVVSDIC